MSQQVLEFQGPAGPLEVSQSNPLPVTGTIASALPNPLITEDDILSFIRNGQGYVTSANLSGAGGATNYAVLSVFNPAASGKNVLVLRLCYYDASGTGGADPMLLTTVDPAYATVLTPQNMKVGGAASVVSATANGSVTPQPTGTVLFLGTHGFTGQLTDTLSLAQAILLPAGIARGVSQCVYMSAAGTHFVGINLFHIEF